jgi:hypothetical protein
MRDHGGCYRATLAEKARADFEAVIAHACEAADHLRLAATFAASL